MGLSRAALLLGALIIAAPARAQGPLTWEEFCELAIRNNPDLASARAAREAGVHDYRGSFNLILPQLTFTNAYTDANTGIISSKWNARASANISLFDMGKVASIRSFSSSLEKAGASVRQTSADLRLTLRQAFLQLLFAQENKQVARVVQSIRQRGADLVSLRYDSGREYKGNMMRARAQSLQAKVSLEQAERDLVSAQSVLGRQVGVYDWRTFLATGTLSANSPPVHSDELEKLIARRPEVAVQEASVRVAEAALASARSPIWPTLGASYLRTVADSREFPSSNYGWAFAGTMSIPIFGSGPTATYRGVAAADERLRSARENLRVARVQVMADIERAWAGYANAAASVEVALRFLEAARQRGDEADIRYASGLMSYDNWEIINTDRVNQEFNIIQARLNAAQAQANWDHSMGKELGE